MKSGDIVEVHSRVEVSGSTFIDHGILLNKVQKDDKFWQILVSDGKIVDWNEDFLVNADEKRYLIG